MWAGFEDEVLSVDDPVLTSSTLTVPVSRSGGAFGIVEVHWNASVIGICHLYFGCIVSVMQKKTTVCAQI